MRTYEAPQETMRRRALGRRTSRARSADEITSVGELFETLDAVRAARFRSGRWNPRPSRKPGCILQDVQGKRRREELHRLAEAESVHGLHARVEASRYLCHVQVLQSTPNHP